VSVDTRVRARRRVVLPIGDRLVAQLCKLERPAARGVLCALAVALCAPTILGGFALDDYILLAQVTQHPSMAWAGSAPFDLFRWIDPQHVGRLIDGQGMPWWTFERARCAFFRPLSSLTHALDYRLFSHDAVWMHVHNLLWFALLTWLVAKAYAELLDSRQVAGLATVMFALDSAHGFAVGWISNRNAIIVAVLSVATVICHHRARRDASVGFALVASLYFVLALLAGEMAVGVCGFLFAYALFLDRARWRARVLSLAPYAMLFAVWAVVRSAGHYGSYGIGAYVDPLTEPLAFLRTLPERWFLLLGSQLGRLISDLHGLCPPRLAPWFVAASVLTTLVGIWFVWPALRARASLRFFALGAALAALPLAATIPADRLLLLVGFGVMPALAHAIFEGLRTPRGFLSGADLRYTRLRRYAALAQAGMHLLVDPVLLPLAALSTTNVARYTDAAEASVPADAAIAQQVSIVASVPDSVLLSYVPAMREWNGKPHPQKLYWLNAMPGDALFERRADDTLRVIAPQGLFDRRSEARGDRFAFRPGDKIVLSELTIEVRELNADGRPSVCDFKFAHALEWPHYRWQTWDDGELRSFSVPKLGETKRVTTSAI
jgi:hypothetical protein